MSFLNVADHRSPGASLGELLAELNEFEAFMDANSNVSDLITDALADATSARECAIFESPATTLEEFRQKLEIVLRPGITPSDEARKSLMADLDRLIK